MEYINANETLLSTPEVPGGILLILSDGDDRMGTKIKSQKNPWGFQLKPKKIPGPKN